MKAARTSRNSRDSGNILVIVICLAGILMLAGISLTWMTGSLATSARKVHQGVQALCSAESGIANMLSKLSTNYAYWQNNSFSSNLLSGTNIVGSYAVTCATNSGHVLIRSVGYSGTSRRSTTLELLGTKQELYADLLHIKGIVIAGGDITLDTSALTINGSMHANQSVYSTQGGPNVNGNISACGTVGIDPTPPGQAVPGVPAVAVPTYLPFDDWKTIAQQDGAACFKTTSFSWSGASLNPPHGVVYVCGDASISGRSDMRGTLVAEGTISIANQFTQTPFNTNWPALLAGTDVIEDNRNDVYGTIFAGRDIELRNNRSIKGALIALNNVTAKNRVTLDPLPQTADCSPLNDDQKDPQIVIGGWLD